MNDAELLQRFVREDSQTAFAELVRRHVDLVFSAARRQLGDAHLAEEVTQSVFCLLARKATGLIGCVSLSGWLYRSTGNLAAQALRTELRRRRREQEAATMPITAAPSEDEWARIAPHLDRAMQQLGETDRHAVLLRYFERKPMRDVGEALGVSEAAAKMRVGRALDRLRALLAKQGATGSAAALGALLSAQAVQAAPPALVSAVLAAASSITAGTAVATSLTTPLALMAKLNLKTVGLVAVALALVGGGTHFLRQQTGLEEPDGIASSGHASNANGRSPAGPDATELASPHATESSEATALEQAKAQLRAALQIPKPTTGHWQYPTDKVLKALEAFGSQRKEALGILMDAFASPNDEAKLQAIAAMGRVGCPEGPGAPGEPASGVRPLLMSALMADDRFSYTALGAYSTLRLDPSDLSNLALLLSKTENLHLLRYIPEHVARAAALEPAKFQDHLLVFRELLDSDDFKLRFRAANALSATDAESNPQILAELVAGLKLRETSLEALESLERLGPKAKPVLDEVLAYAKDGSAGLRDVAFKTLGAIDSELRNEMPGVDKELKKSELMKNWAEKERNRQWTQDDIRIVLESPGWVSGLVDPERYYPDLSLQKMLEAIGDSAKELLPELKKAMSGLTDSQRNELSKIIASLDSDTSIQRFDSALIQGIAEVVIDAAHVRIETDEPPKKVTKQLEANRYVTVDVYPTRVDEQALEIMSSLTFTASTWKSADEILAAANKLKSANPQLYALFVKTATQRDPALAELFPEQPQK